MMLAGEFHTSWASIVDLHTLIVMNILLLLLYAGVMLVNARASGASGGVGWFAGANVSRAAAFLLLLSGTALPLPMRVIEALSDVLAVLSVTLLYKSFAELLERSPKLRWLQYLLTALMLAGAIYTTAMLHSFPAEMFLVSAIMGVQTALTAAVVFRFSGEDVGLAGWLTGAALSLYALLMFMQALVSLRYKLPAYGEAAAEMQILCVSGSLLTNSAVAFGFMFLSTTKLRVELMWRAQIDELTGLLNRWALKRVAMKELIRCKRGRSSFAVVMLDLDGMKAVNDEMGHGCGDAVLQAVAGVLQETVRGRDSVARMGGDEFCVLLPETDLAEAMRVAERLRSEVQNLRTYFRGTEVRINCSLGVASSKLCGLSWQRLMDESDAALYRAKREGKNQVVAADEIFETAETVVVERRGGGAAGLERF